MKITEETRREANETTDKTKRYGEIKSILGEHKDGLTAKEVAVQMYKKKLIPTSERNFSAPRLTELCEKGEVETFGKKKCEYTNKTVAIYRLRG